MSQFSSTIFTKCLPSVLGITKKYINISIYWSSLGVFLPTAREGNVFQACVILSMVEGGRVAMALGSFQVTGPMSFQGGGYSRG